MKEPLSNANNHQHEQRGYSGKQLSLIVISVILMTAVVSFLLIRTYIFPSELEPVKLSVAEELQLDHKLRRLGWQRERAEPLAAAEDYAKAEAYSESGKDRQVLFSEKELNALIGGNPEFARRIAIDLAEDLASAKILVPLPEDFPIMPGRILRVHAGLELKLDSSRRLIVALKGISVMGVPIPNAWLGNLKNVDVVSEFGDRGFWKAFADGVDDIQVRDGELFLKLRE